MSPANRRKPPLKPKESKCIGCGCTDSRACDDGLMGGCSWLEVDYRAGLGVCSMCPNTLPRWKKGGRELHRDRT